MVVGFDETVATESPAAFVERVLVDELRAAVVVVGEDFRFGHDRAGDVALLARRRRRIGGFDVEPVALDGAAARRSRRRGSARCSPTGTSRARRRCSAVPTRSRAAWCAATGGAASSGTRRPTSTSTPDLAVPAIGIYAGTWTRPSGASATAAISVGRRPTFYEDGEVLVEAFLCDFDADLYGERSRLEFVERLRGEQRFDSVDALVAQIERDVDATRELLRR